MDELYGQIVSVMVIQGGTVMLFEGMLIEKDDNFIYLDKSLSGMVDSAIGITSVISIQLLEDVPDVIPEESGDFIDWLKNLKDEDDDDDGGKIQ